MRFLTSLKVAGNPQTRTKTPNILAAKRRGLTLRSSGVPTACHAGHQALGLRPILRLLSSAPCRWRPLSSNVRQHSPRPFVCAAFKTTTAVRQQHLGSVTKTKLSYPRKQQESRINNDRSSSNLSEQSQSQRTYELNRPHSLSSCKPAAEI